MGSSSGGRQSSVTARAPIEPAARTADDTDELALVQATVGNGAVSRLLCGKNEARYRLDLIRGELGRPGEELETETREHLEAELDRDLPPVRVHLGESAARAAKAANATAFAHDSDVVLGAE